MNDLYLCTSRLVVNRIEKMKISIKFISISALIAVLFASGCSNQTSDNSYTSYGTTAATTAIVTESTSVTTTADTTAASLEITADESTLDNRETGKISVFDVVPPDMETIEQFIESESGKYITYAFNTRHSVGISESADSEMQVEADYGMTEVVNDKNIVLSFFNHTDKDIDIDFAYFNNLNSSRSERQPLELSATELNYIDTTGFEEGVYGINVGYTTDKTTTLYFFVKPDDLLTCYVSYTDGYKREEIIHRREVIASAMRAAEESGKNGGFAMDGSMSISNKEFYYPCYSFKKPDLYRCDTDKWIALSNEIVEPEWSDEHKAYVLCDWLRENIAYDNYAVEHMSRTIDANDWSGKYSVYEIRAGKCWDYVNIYAIMCRAQGIPCTSLGSLEDNHMWSLVMINGRWEELDITVCSPWEVDEDYTDRTLVTCEWSRFAFNEETPHYGPIQNDAEVNIEIMCGDPYNGNNYVSRIH